MLVLLLLRTQDARFVSQGSTGLSIRTPGVAGNALPTKPLIPDVCQRLGDSDTDAFGISVQSLLDLSGTSPPRSSSFIRLLLHAEDEGSTLLLPICLSFPIIRKLSREDALLSATFNRLNSDLIFFSSADSLLMTVSSASFMSSRSSS
jgi:hypothetical protein